jgi:hypothetical protein
MEPRRLDGLTLYQQADALSPVEICHRFTEAFTVFGDGTWCAPDAMLTPVFQSRRPAYASLRVGDQRVRDDGVFPRQRFHEFWDRIWIQDGVIVDSEQMCQAIAKSLPRLLLRQTKSASASEVFGRIKANCWNGTALAGFANPQIGAIVTHDNGFHTAQGPD